MKGWAKVTALLLSVAAIQANAQSALEGQGGGQETQARGFWTDPSTGLTWAGKDNGKDVSWKGAVKFCRDLRFAGYSDWRLANAIELQSVYDRTADAPGLAGQGKGRSVAWHVKGDLFLTGNQWANNQIRRHSGYEYYFDFNAGSFDRQPTGFPYPFTFVRALCVRGSTK